MTYRELTDQVREIVENFDMPYVGVRFEEKKRLVGEICEESKRLDDDREFPEYGSEEYNNCETLDGTSAWNCFDGYDRFNENCILNNLNFGETEDSKVNFLNSHIYIIAGNKENTMCDECDENEIVIENAEVFYILK